MKKSILVICLICIALIASSCNIKKDSIDEVNDATYNFGKINNGRINGKNISYAENGAKEFNQATDTEFIFKMNNGQIEYYIKNTLTANGQVAQTNHKKRISNTNYFSPDGDNWEEDFNAPDLSILGVMTNKIDRNDISKIEKSTVNGNTEYKINYNNDVLKNIEDSVPKQIQPFHIKEQYCIYTVNSKGQLIKFSDYQVADITLNGVSNTIVQESSLDVIEFNLDSIQIQ